MTLIIHHNLSRKLKKKLKRKQKKKRFQGRKRKRIIKRRKKRKMRRGQQNKIKRKMRRMGVSALSRMFSNRNRSIRRPRNRWLGGDYNEFQQNNKTKEAKEIITAE